ncbi:uncharacterized protein TRAVEDRAFT_46707 [Trametes versicolor FP-101664 SS1]|uniref:uncharacterized protein n=1 Tax=Trametes versicolor (strain FP-101664) TaxID=717944 RepID=UPI0004623906|nr:uncharacterized protein TRAVEDRAFT_46707 [Trametes versicolor FP-101664 SS1]EIW59398.1 hypothetical protein TRAVEDRAFT_46707 [Trametes versicolor FP-101664 SS1]
MSRTSSNPAQPRARPRPRRQDVPQRPSSAGHTPGTALKPLPVFTDPWVENAAQDSHKRDDTHRLRHPSRKDVSEARAPSRPQAMPTVVAPSPARAQAMPIVAPSPIRAQGTTTILAPSPIRPLSLRTVAGSRLKGFGTPVLSEISSESSANDEEPHGGFYDAQGYPVKGLQVTADDQAIESPSSAGWKTASTATLVPTPRSRKHEVRTPAYQCGNYALYHPEGSVTPRPKAATRRAPRPRSNSFGGY